MYVCWSQLFPWHGEQYKGMHTQMQTQQTHTCLWIALLYPRVHGCLFGDGVEYCQGKAVYTGICSVLLCSVFNMTHIKRLWAVMSLFAKGRSLRSLNYWGNGAHLCLGEYQGSIADHWPALSDFLPCCKRLATFETARPPQCGCFCTVNPHQSFPSVVLIYCEILSKGWLFIQQGARSSDCSTFIM